MRPLSLLERLGENVKERKKRSVLNSLEQSQSPDTAPPEQHSSEIKKPSRNQKQEQRKNKSSVEASAFAGKASSSTTKNDLIHELKLNIQRRIVDEMTPEEEALLIKGEEAREQIKMSYRHTVLVK